MSCEKFKQPKAGRPAKTAECLTCGVAYGDHVKTVRKAKDPNAPKRTRKAKTEAEAPAESVAEAPAETPEVEVSEAETEVAEVNEAEATVAEAAEEPEAVSPF